MKIIMICDSGEPFLDANSNGSWDGPVLTEKAVERDGSWHAGHV